jgi:methionyl-tRNA synthetase
MRKILVTSALPYANGSIHLGHLVEYIQTDIWVRFQKMQGNTAYYICADDTHGTPIMLMAEQEKISPEELVEKIHKEHSKDFEEFHVNFDNFYLTNSSENKELSEDIYKALFKNNKILEKEIEQFYDPNKKMFLPDRFIKGECPKCKAKDQYGDSCEVCGSTYNPTDLINPYSVLTGASPIKKKTKHYFFKLSECSDFLLKWTKSGTLQKEASNKLEEWFKSGLADWDISRDAPYFGFEIHDAPGKFFYVWLDAPIGYMASFKNFAEKNKISFDDYWKNNSKSELVHFIGKDILYFHALFWPATLEYSGYRKPTKIFAHGFLTVNGEKMSKSRGTFITARSYLDNIKNPNFLRYYYASKLNDSMEDIDLNLEDFLAKVNSDLVGKFINIPSRTSGFISKYFENQLVPISNIEDEKARELVLGIVNMKDLVLEHYELRMFSKLIKLLMSQVEVVNEFVSLREPWVLAKNENQHIVNSDLHQICSTCLHAFRLLSIFLTPIIPDLTSKVALFFKETPYDTFSNIEIEANAINKYEHLMQRLESKDIEGMVDSGK